LFLVIGCLAGCSDVPPAPPRFQIDPEKAAQEAMRLYDKNQDGTLDAKELTASPPLAELLKNVKAREPNHADSLTAADIQRRLEEWNKSPVTLVSGVSIVQLDGKPLPDATVTFEPEPFLGSSYRVHHGKSDVTGACQLDADVPEFPQNIYVGLYRVRISKLVNGKESIPPQYNNETILGREIASDTINPREGVFFRLKSK
jgi:hypothetical protein